MKCFLKKHLKTSIVLIAVSAMFSSSIHAEVRTGQIHTSFVVDSPVLTVSVPTEIKLHLNETFTQDSMMIAGFTAPGDYKRLPLYSDPIKISNATLSKDVIFGIPVVATLYATLKPSDDVKISYDENNVNVNSGEKNVFINLVGEPQLKKSPGTATTGDVYDITGDGVGATITAGPGTAATNGGGQTIATAYGSMMQIAIPGPRMGVGEGETKPIYGGFALAGLANVSADWDKDDLGVDLYYKIKATNTAYDADEAVRLATDTTGALLVAAANDMSGYMMLDAIKAAEGLLAAPINAYDGTKVVHNATNDAYFAFEGVDPTLTVTKFGYNFADESGNRWDYVIPEAEYKTANIYCQDISDIDRDRILYINLLKDSAARAYAGELAKKKGVAEETVKLFVVLSDGSVYFQDINFEAKP